MKTTELCKWKPWAIWAIAFAILPGQSAIGNAQPPGLRFEKTSLDLGELRGGVLADCRFDFTNAGASTVELLEARPGCGCVNPRLPQRELAPGASGELVLELKTLSQPAGPHTWHLTLSYRDGDKVHEQDLQVTAFIRVEVDVQPASLTLFTAGKADHAITLTDLRSTPLTIVSVESTSANLGAVAGPFVQDAAGHFGCKINVQTSPTLAPGRHDELLVVHTNDANYPEFRIPIAIMVQTTARISATPAEVSLKSGPRMVKLRDSRDEAVIIEGASSDHNAVLCTWASGPDHQATLRIQMNPDQVRLPQTQPPAATALVRVQIQAPVREVVVIQVQTTD